MHVETLVVPPLDNNVYLVVDEASHEAVVIDTALGSKDLLAKAESLGAKIVAILNTHGHADHTADDAPLKAATGAKLGIFDVDAYRLQRNAQESHWFLPAPAPAVTADLLLKEGTTVHAGGVVLETIHTPGHTEGSSCFYDAADGVLFSGDTLFKGSCGRTDTLGASPAKMKASLQRLARLPPETLVLPGHGPSTTIGQETWIADLAYPVI